MRGGPGVAQRPRRALAGAWPQRGDGARCLTRPPRARGAAGSSGLPGPASSASALPAAAWRCLALEHGATSTGHGKLAEPLTLCSGPRRCGLGLGSHQARTHGVLWSQSSQGAESEPAAVPMGSEWKSVRTRVAPSAAPVPRKSGTVSSEPIRHRANGARPKSLASGGVRPSVSSSSGCWRKISSVPSF